MGRSRSQRKMSGTQRRRFGPGPQSAAPRSNSAMIEEMQATQQAPKKEQPKDNSSVPIIDQHELDHGNNGAFCGLATMIMMLRGNGIEQGSDHASLNQLADRVYHPGQGTSGAQMAQVLREKGLEDSSYTTTGGMSGVTSSLDKGQTVPFGVVHAEGTVTKLEGGSSERYPSTKVGDEHYHKFGGSGHWLLITRYEGKPEAPSVFYVNDPDLGGELRCTRAQIEAMGAGNGNFWMVQQS